jgi:hypothetical protein
MKTFIEIKEALKICICDYNNCRVCPYYVKSTLDIDFLKSMDMCTQNLTKDIIEIIDEYERLKNENNK